MKNNKQSHLEVHGKNELKRIANIELENIIRILSIFKLKYYEQ